MSVIKTRKLFFLLAVFLLASRAWAFDAKQPFDVSADMIEYSDADQVITGEGHVVVVQKNSTLSADRILYDRLKKRIFAQGHVILNENQSIAIGETLDYDLEAEKGTFTKGMGYASPWRFSGDRWARDKDSLIGSHANVTSCDLVDPHYHIRSTRIHVVPNQRFWAWNNWFFIDKLPVFYSPFLYRDLEKRNVVVQFQPGHDDVNGNFVKTQTTVRFADRIYNKFLFDHYAQQGNGFGDEFNYERADIKGSLFGYYIKPHGANLERIGAPQEAQYNLRSYHWQRLSSLYTIQSSINLRRNVSFNNQYFPQDTGQSVSDINSSLALTRQGSKSNQRLVFERLDAPDAGDTDPFAQTHMQTASLPRYDFTLYQTPLWSPKRVEISSPTIEQRLEAMKHPQRVGPVFLQLNGSAQSQYQRVDGFMHNKGQVQATVSQSYTLPAQLSFTPSLSPQINAQDRFDQQHVTDSSGVTHTVAIPGSYEGYQSRLGTSNVLRWRASSQLTLDQTYTLTGRMTPNEMSLDRGLADGGIETHRLSWLAYWRPSRIWLMRTSSGYDLRKLADELPNTYRQRKWDPLNTEITLSVYPTWEYFFRYQAGFYPTRVLQWETSARYRGPYKTLLESGVLYTKGLSGQLTWNNRLGVYFSPSWRADIVVHSLVPALGSGSQGVSQIIDSEFIVTRELHCWYAQFIYRNRPPFSREYSITFNLKLGANTKKEITNQDVESQFYPWRDRAYAN